MGSWTAFVEKFAVHKDFFSSSGGKYWTKVSHIVSAFAFYIKRNQESFSLFKF